MLPSEFVNLYGPVVWERYVVENAVPLLIPQDSDRYLLVFWATSATASINPEPGPTVIGPGSPWLSTDKPLVLSHTVVGSLVNKSWTITTTVGPISVQIIQGFMRASNGKRNARPSRTKNQLS